MRGKREVLYHQARCGGEVKKKEVKARKQAISYCCDGGGSSLPHFLERGSGSEPMLNSIRQGLSSENIGDAPKNNICSARLDTVQCAS